jgi:hypothetical protein
MLFNDPEKLRNLYNALTGSSYGEETPVVINTLKDALFQGLRNDISFTIGERTIVLIEHQSTLGKNVPLRMLFYLVTLYETMIKYEEFHGSREIDMPCPELYLLYNGTAPFPDKKTIKFSKVLKKENKVKLRIEFEVEAYNINAGHNKELMEKVKELKEYAEFVDIVRKKQAGKQSKEERETSFLLAIKECIKHNILKEFLEKHGGKAMKNLLSITMEDWVAIQKKESWEDGLEEGLAKGREEKREIARKAKAMGLPIAKIAEMTGLTPKEIKKL